MNIIKNKEKKEGVNTASKELTKREREIALEKKFEEAEAQVLRSMEAYEIKQNMQEKEEFWAELKAKEEKEKGEQDKKSNQKKK